MSEYDIKATLFPFPLRNEAKEKRRKVLEAVRARRKISYTRYFEKLAILAQRTEKVK